METAITLPEGATSLAFKSEGHERGVEIGPVWFIVEGTFVPALEGPIDFTGAPSARWFTRPEAEGMAALWGLALDEA